jgi:hypothetical protein
MARGFESKDVEFQQAEAERSTTRRRATATVDPRLVAIEMSLTRMRADLARASVPAHQRMIREALAALEAELHALSRPD